MTADLSAAYIGQKHSCDILFLTFFSIFISIPILHLDLDPCPRSIFWSFFLISFPILNLDPCARSCYPDPYHWSQSSSSIPTRIRNLDYWPQFHSSSFPSLTLISILDCALSIPFLNLYLDSKFQSLSLILIPIPICVAGHNTSSRARKRLTLMRLAKRRGD
jgi:hypothetical protein